MNAKSITALVFASFGFIAFPLAVLSHFHLYADGAFFFARIVETGRHPVAWTWHSLVYRSFAHIITQYPSVLALQAGISDISTLSRIYGASLYYIPFTCYAMAACLLFRKGMHTQATLLALMYTILVYFTSYFIISESHLSTGLFVLTISIIATRRMRNIGPLLVLVCLGTIGLLCYEFWAIFFPICLAYFLCSTKGQEAPSAIKPLQGLIVLLYTAGSVASTGGIIFSKVSAQRNAMFSFQLHSVLPFFLAACLFFGSIVVCSCFGSTLIRILNLEGRVNGCRRFPCLHRLEAAFPSSLWISFAVSIFLYFRDLPSPQNAYALRSLNLLLPLMFASSFLAPRRKTQHSTSARKIALCCVLPMLVLTMQASLYHTFRWNEFKTSVFAATQQLSGFVPVNEAKISNPSFLWRWTSPTLSILVQAMQGRNVQSILFNPNAKWQPYGPSESEGAARLAKSMHSGFIMTEMENTDDRKKSDK
jgi:hypothetical protein